MKSPSSIPHEKDTHSFRLSSTIVSLGYKLNEEILEN